MTRPTTLGTRLTDRKRAAIIAAAVSEFQESGFDGTSMDRIAAEAGVSKRTVYNHFPSKDDLFQAIVSDLLGRCTEVASFPYDADTDLKPQLLAIGQSIAAVMTSADFMRLARVVVPRFIQSPEIASATIREQEKFHKGLVEWIQAGKRDGRLRVTHPSRAAQQFTGLIDSFAFWPQLIGTQAPLKKRELTEVIKSAVGMFLDHYAT